MDCSSATAVMTEQVDMEKAVGLLNAFLRDEIAAELSYRLTSDRLAGTRDAPYLGLLKQFEEEHGLAAETIRDQIRQMAGEAADAEGTLGAWAGAATCGGTLFRGQTSGSAALECLREGELHNMESLHSALPAVDAGTRQLLDNLLIPTQRRHVRVLNELLGQSGAT